MTEQEKQRYLISIICIISALFVLVVYVNWFETQISAGLVSFFQAVLPSVFVALIATPVVYFLLEKKGIVTGKDEQPNNMNQSQLIEIEKNIKEIKRHIGNVTERNRVLGTRKDNDFSSFEEMIENAENEIWLSGLTLDITSSTTPILQKKAEKGLKIRLLGLNIYNENLLKEIVNYFKFDENSGVFKRIDSNFSRLYTGLICKYPNSVELRISNYRPTFGFFAVDPNNDDARMTATGYLFNTPDSTWSPVLFINKRNDGNSFKAYSREFMNLWNDAVEWKPEKSNH